MLMGVVDTMMVGRLSAAALAAAALANLYFFSFAMFGMGVLFALDPIVAQALGAGDELAVRRGLQRGLCAGRRRGRAGVARAADRATRARDSSASRPRSCRPRRATSIAPLPSVWPFYVFVVLRQTLQAHHRTGAIMFTIVVSNVLNAGLNYVWIYGELGISGDGVARFRVGDDGQPLVHGRVVARARLAVLRDRTCGASRRTCSIRRRSAACCVIGAPIGAQFVLESGAFGVVALLMGWLGVTQVAAHQVVLNLASLTFMVPLGVASAAAVIVGHAVGRGDAGAVRRSTVAALGRGRGVHGVDGRRF